MSWAKKTSTALLALVILLWSPLTCSRTAASPSLASTTSVQAQGLMNHPVILIHGLGGRWERWDESTLWATLRENGYNMDLVVRFRYPLKPDGAEDSCGDVVSIANELDREVNRLSAESQRLGGPADVDIVGHSLGGLITRQYLSQHVDDHKVRKFIEIGTPNLGPEYLTWIPVKVLQVLAKAAHENGLWPSDMCEPTAPAIQQLVPDGQFMATLNSPANSPTDVDYNPIYGQIKIGVERKLFHWTISTENTSIGDGLVSVKSATTIPGIGDLSQKGAPGYHPHGYHCDILRPKLVLSVEQVSPLFYVANIAQLRDLWSEIQDSPCSHSGLMKNDDVRQTALDILDEGFVEQPPAPLSQPPVSASTATALVIDISGSMGDYWQGGVKIDSAKSAASQMVNMMEAESQVGGISHRVSVASFSTDAHLDLNLTEDYNNARETISWLGPWESTNVGAGLTVANEELARADPQSSRFIILLSDGMTNEGLGPDEIIAGPVQDARNAGVCIYTIGFGDSGDIDEDLLRRIAAGSACGEYYYATDAYRLESVYVEIRHRALGELIGSFSGQVAQGQTVQPGEVTVEPGRDQLAATLNWPGSTLNLILTDPAGQQVDESYPGASVFLQTRPVYFIIENPQPGVWQVAVAGTSVPEGITSFNVILSTREAAVPVAPDNSGLILVTMGTLLCVLVIWLVLSARKPSAGVWVLGTHPARFVPVQRGVLSIGRDPGCSLSLADPKVSRTHAEIGRTARGYSIRDLNSTNGTIVNDRKISSEVLADGDEIKVGDTRLRFQGRRTR